MASTAEAGTLYPDELVDGYERALIGGHLWAPEVPLPPLLAEEFFLERHRIVWEVLGVMAAAGERPSLPGLVARLRQADGLEACGGLPAIVVIFEEGTWAVPMLLAGYAERVREAATSRAVRRLGQELAAQGLPPAEVEARVRALPPPLTLRLGSPRDRWREVQARWGRSGLHLGLPDVDRRLGGLYPGDLVVVGGRTSYGKTSVLTSAALHALAEGGAIAFLTLEMSAAATFRRFVGARARLRLTNLRSGAMGAADFELADATARWLEAQPLTILDAADLGGKGAERILLAVAAAEAPVVMLDHLQEVVTPTGESRAYELGRFVGALKEVAVCRGKILVVAAQLLRQADERRVPSLADLKESGATEERADVVLLLDYPAKRGVKDALPERLDVYVAKNRDGGTGPCKVRILPEYGLVLPLEPSLGDEPAWVRSET